MRIKSKLINGKIIGKKLFSVRIQVFAYLYVEMYLLLTVIVTFCAANSIAGQEKPIARTGLHLDLGQDGSTSEEFSEEASPPMVAVILVNDNDGTEDESTQLNDSSRQRIYSEYDDDVTESDSELTNMTDSPKMVLRKLWQGCNKKAMEVCRKACDAVAKHTCRAHKCKGKLKSAFEKECRSECKHRYIKN